MQPNFIESVMKILEMHNITPNTFEFEMTENTVIAMAELDS